MLNLWKQWKPGPKVIKKKSCSTQFILLISMINTTSGRPKARNFCIFRYCSFYEQLKFMLCWVEHEKSFITSGPDQLDQDSNYFPLGFKILLKAEKLLRKDCPTWFGSALHLETFLVNVPGWTPNWFPASWQYWGQVITKNAMKKLKWHTVTFIILGCNFILVCNKK